MLFELASTMVAEAVRANSESFMASTGTRNDWTRLCDWPMGLEYILTH